MAALLYAGPGSVITGRAALLCQGIGTLAPSVLDVLVPAKRQCRSLAFVSIHQTSRMPQQVIVEGRRRYAMKDHRPAGIISAQVGLAPGPACGTGAAGNAMAGEPGLLWPG